MSEYVPTTERIVAAGRRLRERRDAAAAAAAADAATARQDRIERWAERLYAADLVVDYPVAFEDANGDVIGWGDLSDKEVGMWRAVARVADRAGFVHPEDAADDGREAR